MENMIIKYCKNILNSNEKITSMKIPNIEENINENYINIFYENYPQYKDTIIMKYIKNEINNKYENYLLLTDKKYIEKIEDKVLLSIQKKCSILIKKNELVDILRVKVHNKDELNIIIENYYNIHDCRKEFDLVADQDNTYFFISIMNLEKYNREMKNN